MIKNLKIDDIIIPNIPFIWSYKKTLILPIISIEENNDETLIEKYSEFIKKNINDTKYDIEIYTMTQQLVEDINILNLSGHSWIYSIFENNTNLSKTIFKNNLLSGIFIDSVYLNNIESINICLNKIGETHIHIHDKAFSPCNNMFKIIDIHKDIEFVSICVCDSKQKICVTIHKLIKSI